MAREEPWFVLVVFDKVGALLGHRDERRDVLVDQRLLERCQLAESVNLGHTVLAQRALQHIAVRCGGVRMTRGNRRKQ